MAYINTGTARSLKISVNKKVGGNQVQGYPKTYDGQQSWGNPTYTTLTDTQLRQLSDTDFNTRYAAFVAYVESVEDGIDFDTDVVGDGASKLDLTLCGTTTTSTTTAVPATTTTTVAAAPALRVDMFQSGGGYVPNVSDGATVNMLSSGSGSTSSVYSVSVNVVNTGTANLIVSSITELEDSANQFQKTVSGLSWTIAPSLQNGFTIEFNGGLTATAGSYEAVYQIVTNAGTFDFVLAISVF